MRNTIHAADLCTAIQAAGIPDVVCGKQLYFFPSSRWFGTIFPKNLQACLAALGLRDYAEQRWNCVDFARFGVTASAIALNETINAEPPSFEGVITEAALAVGLLRYVTRDGLGHCINLGVVNDSGRAQVLFLEPQPAGCGLVELTPGELASGNVEI